MVNYNYYIFHSINRFQVKSLRSNIRIVGINKFSVFLQDRNYLYCNWDGAVLPTTFSGWWVNTMRWGFLLCTVTSGSNNVITYYNENNSGTPFVSTGIVKFNHQLIFQTNLIFRLISILLTH